MCSACRHVYLAVHKRYMKNVHCFVNARCASDDTHNSAGIFKACSCQPASFKINTSSFFLKPKDLFDFRLVGSVLGTCRRCLQTVNDALTNHSVLKRCCANVMFCNAVGISITFKWLLTCCYSFVFGILIRNLWHLCKKKFQLQKTSEKVPSDYILHS